MTDQSSPASQAQIDAEIAASAAPTPAEPTPKTKRKTTKTPKVKPVAGAEIAKVESGPLSITKKGTTLLELGVNPAEVVDIGIEMANSLKKIIERPNNKLYTEHRGKKHVHVEGWTLLGAMMGVYPRETRSEEIKPGCWEAHVELVKVFDGTIVGGASHICTRGERNWKKRDEYCLKSMAATRAVGKALRLGFSWVMVLAGYSPTPEEEMRFIEETEEKPPFDDTPVREPETQQAEKKPEPTPKADPTAVYTASDMHKKQLAGLFKEAGLFDVPSLRLISEWMKNGELMFKHAGDLIYLLKRYRITKSNMPIVANSLMELDIPQVEEYLINFATGGTNG